MFDICTCVCVFRSMVVVYYNLSRDIIMNILCTWTSFSLRKGILCCECWRQSLDHWSSSSLLSGVCELSEEEKDFVVQSDCLSLECLYFGVPHLVS